MFRQKAPSLLCKFAVCLLAIISSGSLTLAGEKSVTSAEESKPVWLVVTRPMFLEIITPLAERRKTQGLHTVISTLPVKQAIASCPEKPSFLLLLGDYQPDMETEPWFIPSVTKEFYRWSSSQRKTFSSDLSWGDLDGDGKIDIPVGRLPARTPADAVLMIQKIMQYETRKPTPASMVLPVWAGDGRYGLVFEQMSTPLLLGILRTHSPKYIQPWILNGALNTPFTGWPTYQPAIFNALLKQTTGLACMIGHGSETNFLGTEFEYKSIDYTPEYARKGLVKPPAGPATVILACYCGDFTLPEPCLAEAMLLAPGGPAGVIAATTESHPLPNMLTGQCFLAATKATPSTRTLGQLWLNAVSEAGKSRNILAEQLLGNIEGSLEKNINKHKLFRDQVLMYALLGDPAMHLPIPKPLKITVKHTQTDWQWSAVKPENATRLIVALRTPLPIPAVPEDGYSDPKKANEALQTANATFMFKKTDELSGDVEWKGTIHKPGLLRLTALTPDSIYVATVKLTDNSK